MIKKGSGIYCIIAIIVLCMLILTACSNSALSKNDAICGNTSANIYNRGLITEQGDWLYGPMNYMLYKTKKDGSGLKKICDDFVLYVNIINDYIYYSKNDDGTNKFGIYRIKKDGTEKKILSDDRGECLNVIGNWIYYSKIKYVYGKDDKITSTEITINKMKTDGSAKTNIVDEKVSGRFIDVNDIFISGEWIYYISIKNNCKLCRIKKDGSDAELISSQAFYKVDKGAALFNISNNWIYYTNLDNKKLYKMKLDGSNNSLVLNEGVSNLNISNDWIFYTSSTSDYLYKIKTDGTNKKLLINESVSCPNIAGGYVFCKTYNDYERLKVSIDGGKVYSLEDNN